MSPAVRDVMRRSWCGCDAFEPGGQARLAQILAGCPHLDNAATHVGGFAEIMCVPALRRLSATLGTATPCA